MSNKKAVYLLAGRRPRNLRTPDPSIQVIFHESGKPSPSIASIGTANGDSEEFFNRTTGEFKGAGAGAVVHAIISPTGADVQAARDILESVDIIFISGGDVDLGMRILREKNMVEFLKGLYETGKPFFGTSAGAIMLSKEWVRWRNPNDSSSAELFPCLGFAPVICDTHDEDYGWEELKTALRLTQVNTRGYGITSGTGIKVFPDSRIEVLSGIIHQYIRRGKRIYRADDILPIGNIY